MQSHNYKPGVSGWMLDSKTGVLELNTANFGSTSAEPKPQQVEVVLLDTPVNNLPSDARSLNDLLSKARRRAEDCSEPVVEFYEERIGDDYTEHRLRMTCTRTETMDELCARLQKAKEPKPAASSLVFRDGLMTISSEGVKRVEIGDLGQGKPFVIEGGQVKISEAAIEEGTIRKSRVADKEYIAGFDLGAAWLDPKAAEEADAEFESRVKSVLTQELMPGGLLHRR